MIATAAAAAASVAASVAAMSSRVPALLFAEKDHEILRLLLLLRRRIPGKVKAV